MNITLKQLIIYSTGLLLAGLFLGWLFFSGPAGQDAHPDHEQLSQEEMDQHVQETHTDEEGNIVYTCSMHPQIRENEPGNCPICGMELIPVQSDTSEVHEDDYSMVMTEAAMKLGEIQTTPVIRGVPEKQIDLPGRIKVDERRLTNVTTHFPGRILDTKVDFTGAPIRKGEPMATIYSPELITAQRELLEAARQKDRNPRMYESAKQKFRLWEFPDEQIDEVESRGGIQREIEILSPVNGIVLSRNIANEQHVGEGAILYEVANLDHLWVVLEAYEEDIDWISTGDPIRFSSRSNPGQNYEATITYIDPVVDPMMRTVGIRADVENFDRKLKPDMLVRGTLRARMDSEKLMVPVSSVLWTGPRSLVFVKDSSVDVPRFEVREVELGVRAGDYYVIEEGVEEGEEVVYHGAFRIDSEMQLADRFSMMNREPGSGAVPVHDHGGMENDDIELNNMEMDD
ncbi:MAG: efflux RND transporter periplasmic adaptor subunit [Balneolales bacterium]